MKSYEQSIQEFGHEIADDLIRREADPNWSITLFREKIAKSLATVYDKDLRETVENLEDAIKKSMKKTKDKKTLGGF
jgi:hypothetical protein